MKEYDKLIFEVSKEGRIAYKLPECGYRLFRYKRYYSREIY